MFCTYAGLYYKQMTLTAWLRAMQNLTERPFATHFQDAEIQGSGMN